MRKTTRFALLATAIAPAIALVPTAALAQQNSDGEADEQKNDNVIIVTAQLREQALIEVPASVRAVTAEELENRNVRKLSDMQTAIPGLWIVETSPGLERLQIRGISQQTGLPTVATYFDEVNLNPPGVISGLDIRAVDLERVEVLKGPQPTLYGEGAMGGTIRYISANPDMDEMIVRGSGQVGFIDDGDMLYRAEAAVSVPLITDTLAVRIAAAHEYSGGYVDTTLGEDQNGVDATTIRGKLRFTPSPDFEATAMLMYHEYEQPDSSIANDDLTYIFADGEPQQIDSDYIVGNLVLSYDTAIGTIVSSTGYLEVDALSDTFFPFTIPLPPAFGGPIDAVSYTRSLGDFERWTQELRVVSPGTGPLNYIVGASYTDDSLVSTLADPFGVIPDTIFNSSTERWSVFGEASYRFGNVELQLGGRYFEDKRSDVNETAFNTFKTFNPKATLTLHTGDSGILYVSAAKGFRSGGFNTPGLFAPGEETFDPEKLWTYEIGAKQEFIGGDLYVEAALYYHDYTDIQSVLLPIDNSPRTGRTINSGEADGIGAELLFVAKPDDFLTFTGTFGYNALEYKTASLAVQPGDPFDNVPEFTVNLTMDYERPISDNATVFAQADLGFSSGYTATLRLLNTLPIVQRNLEPFPIQAFVGDRTVINLRGGVDLGGIQLFGYVENLTNNTETTYAGGVITVETGYRPRPRTIGAGVNFRF